jgi:plasmid stability protein
MGQLIVRRVDDGLIRALKERAAKRGRSMEAEHRAILRDSLAAEASTCSFKEWMGAMPEVGMDEDFAAARDYPRDVA